MFGFFKKKSLLNKEEEKIFFEIIDKAVSENLNLQKVRENLHKDYMINHLLEQLFDLCVNKLKEKTGLELTKNERTGQFFQVNENTGDLEQFNKRKSSLYLEYEKYVRKLIDNH